MSLASVDMIRLIRVGMAGRRTLNLLRSNAIRRKCNIGQRSEGAKVRHMVSKIQLWTETNPECPEKRGKIERKCKFDVVVSATFHMERAKPASKTAAELNPLG